MSRSTTLSALAGTAALLATLLTPAVVGAETADADLAGSALVVDAASSDASQPLVDSLAFAASSTGDWIDTTDRSAVVAAYSAEFSGSDPSSGWTGNRSSCTAGTTSQAYRNAIFDRVNFFRAMAGVPAGVTEDPNLSAQAQQAALMMSVSGRLSHNPDSSFGCYTAAGDTAAGKSNLYLGRTGPAAITGYILDPGANNASVGHRNWILHPTTTTMGTGDIPSSGGWAANTLWTIGDNWYGSQPALRSSDGTVAWPPAGYVPGELVYPRWSLSLRDADFRSASVSVSRNGTNVPVSIEHRSGGRIGPFPIIVWNANGAIDTSPAVDTTYDVTVSNVTVNGSSRSFSYSVTVIGAQSAPVNTAEWQPFINSAFNDFLGRNATSGEVDYWAGRLANGTSRRDFVDGLSRSSEWTAFVVDQLYLGTLGRTADAGGRAYWIAQLQSGMTVATAAAAFYGSPEYLAREGGQYQTWLVDLYDELLLRAPDQPGLTFWIDQAEFRGSNAVAYDFYQSLESRRTRVVELYAQFLGRSPDAAGLDYWAGVLQSGNDLALAAELAASEEYFLRS